jgi:hypothetical protein
MFLTLENAINTLVNILSGGVANLLMAVAFIAFLLAVINYILKRRAGEAKGLEQAGSMLFGAVFGLFIMVSVWGIVNFLSSNLLVGSNNTTIQRPQTMWNMNGSNSGTGSGSGSANRNPNTGGNSTYQNPAATDISATCDRFTNNACPLSRCKVDPFDGCVIK